MAPLNDECKREHYLKQFMHERLPTIETPWPKFADVLKFLRGSSDATIAKYIAATGQETAIKIGLRRPQLRERVQEKIRCLKGISAISRDMMRFVFLDPFVVRHLDFSGCSTDSNSMRLLILQCWLLEELHVDNSRLSRGDLVAVLDHVRTIKVLALSAAEHDGGVVRIGRYANIEVVMASCVASRGAFCFLMRLLNSFTRSKVVQICLLQGPYRSVTDPDIDNELPDLLSADLWKKYKVVVTSYHMLSRANIFKEEMLRCIYANSPLWPRVGFQHESFVIYDNGKTTEAHLKKTKLNPRFPKWDRFYDVDFAELFELDPEWRRGEPTGLTLVNRDMGFIILDLCIPPLEGLSSLTELDLTQSHGRYTEESWCALISSAPNLWSFAGPACVMQDLRIFFFHLKDLKLRHLRIEGKTHIPCKFCWKKEIFSDFALGYLSNFRNLSEFTLIGVGASARFFGHIYEFTSIRTLRLSFTHIHPESLDGMVYLMFFCQTLTTLTVQSPDLELDSEGLWRALRVSRVKSLCLSTKATTPVNLALLDDRVYVPLKTLTTLHLHAENLENVDAVASMLEASVEDANREKEGRKLRFVNVRTPALGTIGEKSLKGPVDYNIPGREMCCLNNFIAKSKPVGWGAW